MQLSISSDDEMGAFQRLLMCSTWLRDAAPLLASHFPLYLRKNVNFVETLSYYMLDMNHMFIYRYKSRGKVSINCSTAPLCWVAAQIAFAIITGNQTMFFMSQEMSERLKEFLNVLEKFAAIGICWEYSDNSYLLCDFAYMESPNILVDDASCEDNGRLILESMAPGISTLLIREVRDWRHLRVLYGDVVSMPMDEFDLLPTGERDVYVRQRADYLVQELTLTCPFYRNLHISSGKSLEFATFQEVYSPHLLDGAALASHVPPYGTNLISQQDALPPSRDSVSSPVALCKYEIAFASGGTSGQMKFVYRTAWEDQENARYLAKGLHAQGIGTNDRVMNFLSSGLWGGMHVFGLALGYIGCGVLPTGPGFPDEDTLRLMVQLQPTAILGTPSYILKLADCLERLRSKGTRSGSSSSDIVDACMASVHTVISGGEQLFSGMQRKIEKAFGVRRFLSTGYTSNETGAIAFRCAYLPPTYFHIHENMQHVKVVSSEGDCTNDMSADKSTSVGRIVTSNLNRLLMPVIGYDIGDSGRLVCPEQVPYANESIGASEDGVCRCGRRLRVLQLLGRWDDRVRVGAQDLYADTVAAAIETVEELSLNFCVHIFRNEMACRDAVEIQVELVDKMSDNGHISALKNLFLAQLAKHTKLDWGQDQSVDSARVCCDSLANNEGQVAEYKSKDGIPSGDSSGWIAEGLIEIPVLTILEPGKLPRNPRTGKIKRIVDHRFITA